LRDRLVAPPADAVAIELFRDLSGRPCGDPGLDRLGDLAPCREAVAFARQVQLQSPAQRLHGGGKAGRRTEGTPLPGRQGDHHHAATVRAREIAAERTEEVVAVARAFVAE